MSSSTNYVQGPPPPSTTTSLVIRDYVPSDGSKLSESPQVKIPPFVFPSTNWNSWCRQFQGIKAAVRTDFLQTYTARKTDIESLDQREKDQLVKFVYAYQQIRIIVSLLKEKANKLETPTRNAILGLQKDIPPRKRIPDLMTNPELIHSLAARNLFFPTQITIWDMEERDLPDEMLLVAKDSKFVFKKSPMTLHREKKAQEREEKKQMPTFNKK